MSAPPHNAPLPLTLIAAVARHGAIGRDNQLLVHLPGDLPRFKRLTLGHAVVMGRKTWDSIGRPLPGRRNVVVTRNTAWQAPGAEAAGSFGAALARVQPGEQAFVIGGAEIYALALPFSTRLLLTEIDAEFEADAFFPPWPREAFTETSSEAMRTGQGLSYRYVTYERHHERN